MFDLHLHSLLSDGVLLPSELARRAADKGLKAIAITDHADISNMDFIIPRIIEAAKSLNKTGDLIVIPGIELTHLPPQIIPSTVIKARELGICLILVHGQTVVEPVIKGTNLAALNSPIDILAHPGLITKDEAELARKNSIYLEISGRKGHSFTNGHVAKIAKEVGAKLILNSDSHMPDDILSPDMFNKIGLGAGLTAEEVKGIYEDVSHLIKTRLSILEERG